MSLVSRYLHGAALSVLFSDSPSAERKRNSSNRGLVSVRCRTRGLGLRPVVNECMQNRGDKMIGLPLAGDCVMFGGQAAAAKVGWVSFAGANRCPKAEPKVPL